MIVLPDGHRMDPATGLCELCWLAYPCAITRTWLLAAYGPGGVVAVWAGEQMAVAAEALPNLAPDELFRRFLEWTRPLA